MFQKREDILVQDNDVLEFFEEDESVEIINKDKWQIIVVDDDESVHSVTSIVLKNFSLDDKKVNIIHAYSAAEAQMILQNHKDIALVLLDVVMETDNAGLKVVKYIRDELKNQDTRIVIRTGQPGVAPEEKIIQDYDIDDYKDKTELTSIKLFTTVYSALKSYRDIQNVIKLQQELERKSSLLDKAQKLAKIGSWEWDFVKDEIVCSREIYDILGINAQEKQNRQFFLEYIHPEDIEFCIKTLEKAIENKQSYKLEFRIVLKNGNIRYIDEKGEVVTDKDGNAIKLFGVSKDVTKDKEIEKIKEENDLNQKKLFEEKIKQDEQKKISDAKDAFLVLFTHELKTPLNAIINFTKYLLKHVSAETITNIPFEKRAKLLKQIELSASKILGDVIKILELSKIKSNKLEYKIEAFDLSETLTEVLEEHESLIEEYKCTLSLEYNCTPKNVQSDVYRFKQVLANIISNAIKYSRGIVSIHVDYFEDEYMITIEDNGPSIENKEKAFELFEQMDTNIIKKTKNGTGIGLNFVKNLCNGLGLKYKLEDSQKLGGLSFQLLIALGQNR